MPKLLNMKTMSIDLCPFQTRALIKRRFHGYEIYPPNIGKVVFEMTNSENVNDYLYIFLCITISNSIKILCEPSSLFAGF